MTKQWYQRVAEVLASVEDVKEREVLARKMASAFKQDNPRFDYVRFYKACGLEEVK
jgi:hypothetical protein